MLDTTLRLLRTKLERNLRLGLRPALRNGLRFATASALNCYRLRHVDQLGVGVRVRGRAPIIDNRDGRVVVGNDVVFLAPVTPLYAEVEASALLTIGDQCFINDGVWIGCTAQITLGRRVLIGPGVRIFDNNYHDLHQRQLTPAGRPVTIGDDVWVGADCIVLPGVTIGRGAVISCQSVVRHDVAPFTVVSGNPARAIKSLDPLRFAPEPPATMPLDRQSA